MVWWMLRRLAENIDLAFGNYTLQRDLNFWIVSSFFLSFSFFFLIYPSLVGGVLPLAIIAFRKLMGSTATC